ncbi:MAG: hypothetical protein QW279_01920, partial [Candidatus Jordarchaeaceae archaeon]
TLDLKKEYDENGRIISEGTYDKKGKKQGSFKIFDPETGIAREEKVYMRDTLVAKGPVDENFKRNGKWEEYYTDGSLKSTGEYKNGKKEGEWKYFFRNGNIEQIGKYLQGLPHGKWIWYYENAAVLREEIFVKGKREGEFFEFSEKGDTILKGYFINDKEEDFWVYQLNDYREEGKYQEGRKTGIWKAYNKHTGKLIFIGEYVDGLENGIHKYFYPDGKIKEEGNYSLGIKQGTWKKYDEEGQIYLTIEYEDGLPVKIGSVRVDEINP